MRFLKHPIVIPIIIFGLIGLVWLLVYVGTNMSPGTYGNVARYQSNRSKEAMRRTIEDFFKRHPENKLADSLSSYTLPFSFGNDSVNRNNPMNADSVNFFVYLQEKNWIMWSSFAGLEDEWQSGKCVVVLRGFAEPPGREWHVSSKLSTQEKIDLLTTFQIRFLDKLDSTTFTKLK